MPDNLEHIANAAKNFALSYDMAMSGYAFPDVIEADLEVLKEAIRNDRIHSKTFIGNDPPKDWSTNDWHDPEYRHTYAEDFLFSRIATQMKVLREQRGWTQEELAQHVGTQQPAISIQEDVNYQGWTIRTLLRFARVFDCWLHISFESYRTFPEELNRFSREGLQREPFIQE